jgi:hypothetical protein
LYPFRPGIKRILDADPVPVGASMALRGLWGSFFSQGRGRDVELRGGCGRFQRSDSAVGALVPPAAATPEALQANVLALRGDWR